MIYINYARLLFFACLTVFLGLVSCQKGIDPNDPDPTIPDEVRDSTLLIKSIAYVFDDGQDSIVEHYSYDSVNRKILLTWDDDFDNYVVDGTAAEFIYNNKGMLSRVVYKYPAGYTQQEYDYNTIDILYDAANVLQKITTKLGNGSIESVLFNKTMFPSGNYQIDWEETEPSLPGDRFPRKAIFNADGKNIINIREHLFVSDTTAAGDYIYANSTIMDSLIYDASGNVSKILTTKTDTTLIQDTESYISYQFLTRQTKGDQLYNQRQVIMNGIANMPFGNSDLGSFIADDAFGILFSSLKYEYLQYSKYPIQAAKIYMWDATYKDFTAHSELDNKNRLTKYIGFFDDYGSDLEPEEYRIDYYK